jgi:hypothetical protein
MSPDLRAELRTLLPPEKVNLVTKSFDIYGSKQKAVQGVWMRLQARPQDSLLLSQGESGKGSAYGNCELWR